MASSKTTLQLYHWCTKTLDTNALWGPLRYWRCPTSPSLSNIYIYICVWLSSLWKCCSSVCQTIHQQSVFVHNLNLVGYWWFVVQCSLFSCLFNVSRHRVLLCMLVYNSSVFPWCSKSIMNSWIIWILWWLCMHLGAKCWAQWAQLQNVVVATMYNLM